MGSIDDIVAHYDQPPTLDAAQDALTRMCRAAKRGTGCHLTAEMIASLSLTSIGQMWEEQDPRITKENDANN